MHTQIRLAAALVLVMAVAFLAACDGSASASSTPVKTDRVDLPPSYKFEPKTIEVAAGTTVTWTNSDNFTHSVKVSALDGESHDMKPGQSVSLQFDNPGEYNYVCTYHEQAMKGKIIVTSP